MLNDVMTLEEAAELWNKSTDSLRQACISRQGRPPRFNIGVEAVQSKRIWLVTRAGMERLYGPLDGKNTAKNDGNHSVSWAKYRCCNYGHCDTT